MADDEGAMLYTEGMFGRYVGMHVLNLNRSKQVISNQASCLVGSRSVTAGAVLRMSF